MPNKVEIVAFLWNDPKAKHTKVFSFGVDHVNKLFRRLDSGRKCLDLDTEISFNVITDHPVASDFDLSIMKYHPMWSDYRDLGRCFCRLPLFWLNFREERLGFKKDSIVIMMDIDQVVINPEGYLLCLLEDHQQAFTGYRDSKNPSCYSGSLWKIDPRYGDVSYVHDTFDHIYNVVRQSGTGDRFWPAWNSGSLELDPDNNRIVNTGFVGSDQCWLTTALGEHSYPFKWDSINSGIWDHWTIEDLPGGGLPENCNAVMVNGLRRDPSLKEYQDKFPWIKEYWVNI